MASDSPRLAAHHDQQIRDAICAELKKHECKFDGNLKELILEIQNAFNSEPPFDDFELIYQRIKALKINGAIEFVREFDTEFGPVASIILIDESRCIRPPRARNQTRLQDTKSLKPQTAEFCDSGSETEVENPKIAKDTKSAIPSEQFRTSLAAFQRRVLILKTITDEMDSLSKQGSDKVITDSQVIRHKLLDSGYDLKTRSNFFFDLEALAKACFIVLGQAKNSHGRKVITIRLFENVSADYIREQLKHKTMLKPKIVALCDSTEIPKAETQDCVQPVAIEPEANLDKTVARETTQTCSQIPEKEQIIPNEEILAHFTSLSEEMQAKKIKLERELAEYNEKLVASRVKIEKLKKLIEIMEGMPETILKNKKTQELLENRAAELKVRTAICIIDDTFQTESRNRIIELEKDIDAVGRAINDLRAI